nr:gamma-glutamylcyclotransferase family protein [uncultured Neokomagataea sp.]
MTQVNEDRSVLLFSYGTLQLEAVQKQSFGRLLGGEKDAMVGYRMDWVEITDPEVLRASGQRFHPVVVPTGRKEDTVEGMVFCITPQELVAADAYEVSDYQRVEATLYSGKVSWVYIKA